MIDCLLNSTGIGFTLRITDLTECAAALVPRTARNTVSGFDGSVTSPLVGDVVYACGLFLILTISSSI